MLRSNKVMPRRYDSSLRVAIATLVSKSRWQSNQRGAFCESLSSAMRVFALLADTWNVSVSFFCRRRPWAALQDHGPLLIADAIATRLQVAALRDAARRRSRRHLR